MTVTSPAVGDPGTAGWADGVAAVVNAALASINGATNNPGTSLANKIQSGRIPALFVGVSLMSGSFTYGTAFTTLPTVVVGAEVANGSVIDLVASINGGTTTGFNWRLRERGNTAVSVSAAFHWFAIGT